VQEEDCDGLCWLYILKEDGIRPDCVVITEPSQVADLSRAPRPHGDRSSSARQIVPRQRAGTRRQSHLQDEPPGGRGGKLNTRLRDDPFLGKGTIAVTEIRSLSPSLCAVPGACSIHLDRR
jgi:hypothetical protein